MIAASLFAPLSGEFGFETVLRMMIVGASCGAVGVWVVGFGETFLAESFTHALLPGMVAAALAGAGLAMGALVGVAVAFVALLVVSRAPRTVSSSATAVTVTTLVGAGALLATTGSSLRFESLLFGDPLAASGGDIAVATVAALGCASALWLLHGRFSVLAFDPGAAPTLGVDAARTRVALLALLVAAVVLAANIAGSLTALALVSGPGVAALGIVRHSGRAVVVAAAIGAACGAAGIYLSYYADWPAGASVALACVAAACAAPAMRALNRRSSTAPVRADGHAAR